MNQEVQAPGVFTQGRQAVKDSLPEMQKRGDREPQKRRGSFGKERSYTLGPFGMMRREKEKTRVS